MHLRSNVIRTGRFLFSSVLRSSRRKTTGKQSIKKQKYQSGPPPPKTLFEKIGNVLGVMPLAIFLAAEFEQYQFGSTYGRDSLAGMVHSLCDGKDGERLRRERYANLQSKLNLKATDNGSGAPRDKANEPLDAALCVDLAGGAPGAMRRMGAWMLDTSLLVLLTQTFVRSSRIKHLIGPVAGVLLWSCRDQWLARWGHQSPGRYICGQKVLALDGASAEIWATMKLNSVRASWFCVLHV